MESLEEASESPALTMPQGKINPVGGGRGFRLDIALGVNIVVYRGLYRFIGARVL